MPRSLAVQTRTSFEIKVYCLFEPPLLAGGKINLVGRVEAAVLGLFAGAGVSGANTASTGSTGRANVFGGGTLASAFTRRTSAARAASTGLDGVLGRGLVAGAVEGGLLATAAGGLLG